MKFRDFTSLALYLLETGRGQPEEYGKDAEEMIFKDHLLAVADRLVRWLVSRANRGLIVDIEKTYNFHSEWRINRNLAWRKIVELERRGEEVPEWLGKLVENKDPGNQFYYQQVEPDHKSIEDQEEEELESKAGIAQAMAEGRIRRRFYALTPAQIFRLARGLEVAEQTLDKHTVALTKGTRLTESFIVPKNMTTNSFGVTLEDGSVLVAALISKVENGVSVAFFTRRWRGVKEASGVVKSCWDPETRMPRTWLTE
jgi:hypothetical protein